MGHLQISDVSFSLDDGRMLLRDVTLKVGEGDVIALVGPNGTGKTTLTRIARSDLAPHEGTVAVTGNLGVMTQFIGSVRDESTVADLLLSVAPPKLRALAERATASEARMYETGTEKDQMAYADAVIAWGDAGGYELETLWDVCTVSAMGIPFDKARDREVSTLSGGEQKRLVLEALLRDDHDVLILDEPDNYLDVPGKLWLEEQLVASRKAILLVSHDRELLNRAATKVATLERNSHGNTLWIHPSGWSTYREGREARIARMEEDLRRWDEEHARIKDLVRTMQARAASSPDMANRYAAAKTKLRKFEEAGKPEPIPLPQSVNMKLRGGRTAKRAVVIEELELTGLMKPFSTEIWYGDRVALLGANGSGKSHFLRLLAAGGSDPDLEHQPVGDVAPKPVAHTGHVALGPRVRSGWFAQTHSHPEWQGKTLLDLLHRGDAHRKGLDRSAAESVLDRYGLGASSEQKFESLSGGQQARFQVLLLELAGATMLLLDEPTDNLDLESAESLESALMSFEGAVIAVTHDRWFAANFERFLVFGEDGNVTESSEPVWDVGRVDRER
ncbi:ABC-F family ATP-binding cassette domain-containing protein [Demequina aurantiaca]|uniref:ABC-F family ATP-binding cassette domain-containing protein n=1 Tax=Demequina aurantiaca TaxID=676200 RepID=UPI0007802D10|nr:ATP-binding cassette domain-containing protein [Demequina aurantiaca]